MAKFESGLFTSDDFLQISQVLYTPKQDEMLARRIFSIDSTYASYAREIGYDYYDRTGSAKIYAKGGGGKDIPFVGESGGRITQKVYDLVTGIRYSKAELQALEAKRALGKGPSIQLNMLRVDTARRYISEVENKLAFSGDTEYGIKGIFDDTFYNGTNLGVKENVAASGTGSGDAAKRLWPNKTSSLILDDLFKAVDTVEQDALFKARILVLDPKNFNRLRKPFTTTDSRTLLDWLNSNGLYFEQIIASRNMRLTNNGDTVNYFMVLDNSPEIVQLAITEDLNLGDPIVDIVGTTEIAVMESTGGIVLRHPAACYIGKGI